LGERQHLSSLEKGCKPKRELKKNILGEENSQMQSPKGRSVTKAWEERRPMWEKEKRSLRSWT
jgi:hypothetical protein